MGRWHKLNPIGILPFIDFFPPPRLEIIHIFQERCTRVHKHMMDISSTDWPLQRVLTNAFITALDGSLTYPRHIIRDNAIT